MKNFIKRFVYWCGSYARECGHCCLNCEYFYMCKRDYEAEIKEDGKHSRNASWDNQSSSRGGIIK